MKYVIGNWKMFPRKIEEASLLLQDVRSISKKALAQGVEVVVCPPAPYLSLLSKKYAAAIHFGVQDVSPYDGEARTGSVSVAHVISSGATYTILGHSEMRACGESSAAVADKLAMALKGGLHAVVCVGEATRTEDGKNFLEVEKQLRESIARVPPSKVSQLIIAYEPVWAVGKNALASASPREFEEMSMLLRRVLAEQFGKTKAFRIPILYGGSVDAKNIASYMTVADGVLVGRASLRASDFSNIIMCAIQCSKK